jgi:PKD repeat protein
MNQLKLILLLALLMLGSLSVHAQKDTIYFTGQYNRMIILSKDTLFVPGPFISNIDNKDLNIHNAGIIVAKGNISNNTKRLFFSSTNAISATSIDTTGVLKSAELQPVGHFYFNGKDTQQIAGLNQILFNNITLNTHAVSQKIDTRIYGKMSMQNGNWNLNGKHVLFFDTLDLGGYQQKGFIAGEKPTSHILGDSGYLYAFRNMNNGDTILGLGLTGTSIGYTQIKRYAYSRTEITDTSIRKYFDVIPKNTGINANVSIEYISTDLLPNMQETELRLWRGIDEITAYPTLEKSTIDTISKRVSSTEVLNLSTNLNQYTLAPQNCKNPPKIHFEDGDSIAICFRDPYVIKASIENYNFDNKRLPYRYVWNGNTLYNDTIFHADSVKSGIYTLLVTDRRGCHTLDTFNVRVKLRPKFRPNVSFHPQTAETRGNCLGHGIRFRARLDSTLAQNQGLKYYWWFGDSTHGTAADSLKIMEGFGNYTTKLKVTNYEGCDTMASHSITVYDLPHPAFSIEKLNSFMRKFNNLTDVSLHALNKTQWNFEDTTGRSSYYETYSYSGKENQIIEQRDTGTFQAKLIVTQIDGMCVDSVTHPFTIRLPSYLSFYPTDTVVCVGENVKFIDNSRIDDMSLSDVLYTWNIDGTLLTSTVSTSPDFTFTSSGLKSITYTVYDSMTQWTGKMTRYVRVMPAPTIGFADTLTTCGKSFIIRPTVSGISKYQWSTGTTTATCKATASGMYSLSVIDNYGCSASDSIFIITGTEIKPRLNATVSSCGPITLSSGYSGYVHQWFEMSDLSTVLSESSELKITQTGNYMVKVFVDSCSGQASSVVTIRKPVILDIGENATLCQGQSYDLNASTGQTDYLLYVWKDGTGTSVSQQPQITVTSSGRYVITATNPATQCSGSDSITINYNPLPIFDLGVNQYLCNNGSIQLSTGLYGEETHSTWSSDNGFWAEGTDVTIRNSGVYVAKVTNGLGCEATDTIKIFVQQTSLTPDFLFSSDVYTYDTVQFIQMSSPTPISFLWNFGDGGTSKDVNPRYFYVYPDSFDVVLTISDGYCNVSKAKKIEVKDISLKKKAQLPPETAKVIVIESAKAYPVPNNGQFTLDVQLSAPSDMIIYLYSIRGALVDVHVVKKSDIYKKDYDLQSLSKGIYIMKIMTPTDSKAFKILIQ